MRLRNINNLKDPQLLDGLKKEDPAIFSYFYKKYYRMIEKLIISKGGLPEDAADVFQDAIIILLSKSRQPDFKLTAKLSTLFYAIARNRWTNIQYHRKKFTGLNGQEEKMAETPPIQIDERLEVVQKAILQLGDGCKDLITQHFHQQLSYAKIGLLNDTSPNYLKVKMHRCMTKLRAIVFPLTKNTKA